MFEEVKFLKDATHVSYYGVFKINKYTLDGKKYAIFRGHSYFDENEELQYLHGWSDVSHEIKYYKEVLEK